MPPNADPDPAVVTTTAAATVLTAAPTAHRSAPGRRVVENKHCNCWLIYLQGRLLI